MEPAGEIELQPMEAGEIGAGAGAIVASAVRGAAAGALVVTLVAAFVAGGNLYLLGPIIDGLVGVTLICLAIAAVNGVLTLTAWVTRRGLSLTPGLRPGLAPGWRLRRWLGVAGHPLLASSVFIILALWLGRVDGPLSFFGSLVPFEILIGTGAIVGSAAEAGIAMRAGGGGRRRTTGTAIATMAVLLAVVTATWALTPGIGDPLVAEPAATLERVPTIDLPDPSASGPFRVARASYGSGVPAGRPEFGREATWRTEPIDASGTIDRPDGLPTVYADLVWGFDTDALPVNGLAWYAGDADAPMPVVLIVHGNHTAGDASDPGYAYLAAHLASRGLFAVSVDENFLNGDAFFDYGGTEMGVRAWLLLAHLDTLRAWNADPSHPLHGRLDLDRVALVGHSRGGEAVALAPSLEAGDRQVAGMPPAPDGFGIRAVVGIAPSDGMYRGLPVALEGVDYLVLQGAHDGDLPGFSGLRTYHRAALADAGALKVALYAGRANHGRFNSIWNDADAGPVHSWLLDRGSLLTPAEQERLAKGVIAAFLARSLQDDASYDAFFRDPRVGRAWLPDDVVETHWESGGRITLGALAGAVDRTELARAGFTEVGIVDPMLRDGSKQGDPALRLAWEAPAELQAAIAPDESAAIDPDGWLTVSLGTIGDTVPDPLVVIRDVTGTEAAVRLGDISPPRPVIPVSLWKLDRLGERYLPTEELRWSAERFMQTHTIALDTFREANRAIDVSRLATVMLRFAEPGTAFVDDLGFEPAR